LIHSYSASSSSFVLSLFSFATGSNINCPLLVDKTTLTSSKILSTNPSVPNPSAPNPSATNPSASSLAPASWVVPVAASLSSLFIILACSGLFVFYRRRRRRRQRQQEIPQTSLLMAPNAYLNNKNSPPAPHQPHLFSFFSKRASHDETLASISRVNDPLQFENLSSQGIPHNGNSSYQGIPHN
jgi:hypothetical protein